MGRKTASQRRAEQEKIRKSRNQKSSNFFGTKVIEGRKSGSERRTD